MIIDGEKVIFSFNAAMEAAYVAEAGSALTVKTHDCFYQHMLEEGSCISTFEMDSANPATGPIYEPDMGLGAGVLAGGVGGDDAGGIHHGIVTYIRHGSADQLRAHGRRFISGPRAAPCG